MRKPSKESGENRVAFFPKVFFRNYHLFCWCDVRDAKSQYGFSEYAWLR